MRRAFLWAFLFASAPTASAAVRTKAPAPAPARIVYAAWARDGHLRIAPLGGPKGRELLVGEGRASYEVQVRAREVAKKYFPRGVSVAEVRPVALTPSSALKASGGELLPEDGFYYLVQVPRARRHTFDTGKLGGKPVFDRLRKAVAVLHRHGVASGGWLAVYGNWSADGRPLLTMPNFNDGALRRKGSLERFRKAAAEDRAQLERIRGWYFPGVR